MFNNSGANIAKEPPADPFQTEDPFKSFNGQNDIHIFCHCSLLGLRLLSAPLDVFFVVNLNLYQVYHSSELVFFGGRPGGDLLLFKPSVWPSTVTCVTGFIPHVPLTRENDNKISLNPQSFFAFFFSFF